ncbi:MAG: SLC13 family permease [Verrucomicrobiia bacterium]
MGSPWEITLILVILLGTLVLFASEKFSFDLVAMIVLGTLLVLGLVTPEEGISGFSNPATITVGAVFVLSAGLQKTGAVRAVGRMFVRLARFQFVLLIAIMLTMACVSAFINNTAAVAVFLPLVLAVAARRKLSASKLLIPLSFASQFGGVCTLIGSSTNLLVSSISERAGQGAFDMFEMGRLGLILVSAGTVYFLLIGRWLLPARRSDQLTEAYEMGEYITELRVLTGSPLIGNTTVQGNLARKHDVQVLEILRDKQKLWQPLHEPIRENDVLLVRGKVKELMEMRDVQKLAIEPEFKLGDATLQTEDMMLVETLVAPRSRLIGHTLADLGFHERYQAIALAIHRRGQTIREKLNAVHLRFGDALLLMGPKADIAKLRGDENFVMLQELEEPSLRRHKVPLALLIIALVVGLAALKIMPIMITAILGSIAMVLTRCISPDEAYEAIDWKVIFLLAGVLPLGIALEKSGAAHLIAQQTMRLFGQFGPTVTLAAIYLLTALMTEMISNNAAAVLLAPIAISTAVGMGVDPKPFLMAVTFAASTSFATPVGYQTNTMVYNAGGYRFTDFMKVGIPLITIFWAISVYFIPKFWPF